MKRETNYRSRHRTAFASSPSRDEYRFVLESRPAITFSRNSEPTDQGDIPTQSGFTHDRQKNPAIT